jgi:hypothetical protein
MLQSKLDAMTTEVATLKEEHVKSLDMKCEHQEKQMTKMKEQEKDLQWHLHEAIDALRGKSSVGLAFCTNSLRL